LTDAQKKFRDAWLASKAKVNRVGAGVGSR
jgi:hypothetical protein